MQPTLAPGDRLLVVSRRPVPGDLVAVADPRARSRLLVKRAVEVSTGGVVVHGDNPAASTDSRDFGSVPEPLVAGVAVYRYAPAHRAGWLRGPTKPVERRRRRALPPRRVQAIGWRRVGGRASHG